MKKTIAIAMLAAVSSTAFANTVTFNGEITPAPCGIRADTLDQVVELGLVPTHKFNGMGSRSQAKDFNIVLTDCDVSVAKNAYFTFSGVTDHVTPALFGVTGSASNVGIRLQCGGEMLANGVEQSSAVILSAGTVTAKFAAMYEATAATVLPGTANSVANFTIRYN